MMADRSKTNSRKNGIQADIPIVAADGQYLSALHPKYLHTNSTSHTWPFSAVAELIDNAYDPDVQARQLSIDVRVLNGIQVLTLTDNGSGMMPDKLYKMVSFGFSEKTAVGEHHPVGQYGNGFKSGSMRLGKDALVFTKTQARWSLGFLSQTYLEKIKSSTIIVPFVTWDPKKFTLIGSESGGRRSLLEILTYSVLSSLHDIKQEFKHIKGTTGTHIMISNLRKRGDGNKYELDFTTDSNDIRIPDDLVDTDESIYKREQRQDHIPLSDYSLRAYCAILYLKPRMQIILRGKKVKTLVIAKSLAKTELDLYTPTGYSKPVKITFGFSQNKNHYGIMMYHKNRLIKPYVRVGYQLKPNSLGVGVIGVIECDFLQPTHNKQDFDQSKVFRACMAGLGRKLNEYWHEKKGAGKSSSSSQQQTVDETEALLPDQKWVQCDSVDCLKWRVLPDDTDLEALPEKWYCKDHPLPEWRSCDIPEKLEDEQEVVTPYRKEVTKQLKREQQLKRKQSETNLKRANELEEMIQRKEKELEEEKRKRTQNEAKAKAQEHEIRRLKLELGKNSSNSSTPNSYKSPISSHIAAASSPRTVPRQTTARPSPIVNGTGLILTSQATPSPLVVLRSSTSQPLQLSPVASPSTKSVNSQAKPPLAAIAVGRATRQSINQAMKLRLPFTTRRTTQATADATTMPAATKTVTAIPKTNVSPATTVFSPSPQSIVVAQSQTIPITTTLPPKSIANAPQLISLTPKSQIVATSTPNSANGLPRVYRFVVKDPNTGGALHKVQPNLTALAVRPATPVTLVSPTPISTPAQQKPTPQTSATKETAGNKQFKEEPSSNSINQQLAQIGIDAIAAQAHDMVPSMAITTTKVGSRQSSNMASREASKPSRPSSTASLAIGDPSSSAKTSQASTPGSKRKVIEIEEGDEKEDSDVVVIETKKKLKVEEKNNENNKQLSNVGQGAQGTSNLNGKATTTEKDEKKFSLEMANNQADGLVEDIDTLPADRMRTMLVQRSQQLRSLRESICQLLGLLVPEINLPRPEAMPLDDNTIDVLLRDVLDANRETRGGQ